MSTRASLGWIAKNPGLRRMAAASATHPPAKSHQSGTVLPEVLVVPLTKA